MKVDYSELAARYSAMAAEEFESIRREDLAEEAKCYYDQEKARRVPGWRYEQPTPEKKLLNLSGLQKRSRRRFKIRMICWAVLFFFLYLSYFLIPSEYSSLRTYIAAIAIIGPSLAFVEEQASIRRTGYVILWLRRFHRREQKPFQNILNQACRFVGMPITIQDSSFRYSPEFAMARSAPVLGVMLFVVIFGGIFVNRIMLDVLVVVVCLLALGLSMMSRSLGFLKFRQADQHTRLLKLLQGIRAGKVRNAGVIVFSCEDAVWRSAVEMAMRHADAVVIDVTELSEHVIWEFQAALSAVSPECVILVCAKDASVAFPVELPTPIQSELQRVTTVPLNRFPTFFYPRTYGFLEAIRNAKSFGISDLQDALLKCIALAPAHDTPLAVN